MVKQVKKAAKKAVLTTKKAVKKTVKKASKQVKAAVKDTKKVMAKVAGKVAHTYTAFKEGGYKSAASAILDFVPIVGNIKAGIEIATGKEMFTNRKLETLERGVGVAAVFGGGLVKGAVRGGKLTSGIIAGGKKSDKNSAPTVKPQTNGSGNRGYDSTKPLSPSNYPNPDPDMTVPPVRYEPKTIDEVIRMRRGDGPTTKRTHGDKNIEAHHREQIPISEGGVFDELEEYTHRRGGNHTRHREKSKLTPSQRRKEITEHYKKRGSEYILPGEGI